MLDQTITTRSACGSPSHFNRRTLLKAAGLAGASWLTPLAGALAREQEEAPRGAPAKSVIMLWMAGAPSQLETFDPKPGKPVSHSETKAIKTRAKDIQLADGLEQLADQMDAVSIVRSVISKEGDHERATYNMKNGFRPDPTLVHPSVGAVICHELTDGVEIPRHISIIPGPWPARGGYLGDKFDAFKINDPLQRIPDVTPRVDEKRFESRLRDLENIVESEFARGRIQRIDTDKTLHVSSIKAAAHDDVLRAACRVRYFQRATEPDRRVRRRPLCPRLPGGGAAGGGRRAVCGSDAEWLGQPR